EEHRRGGRGRRVEAATGKCGGGDGRGGSATGERKRPDRLSATERWPRRCSPNLERERNHVLWPRAPGKEKQGAGGAGRADRWRRKAGPEPTTSCGCRFELIGALPARLRAGSIIGR